MNQLISLTKQSINGETIDTVSARELYTFLEITERFSSWIDNNQTMGYDMTTSAKSDVGIGVLKHTRLQKQPPLSGFFYCNKFSQKGCNKIAPLA